MTPMANTLATAVFEIGDGEVTLRVYDRKPRAEIALDVMNDPEKAPLAGSLTLPASGARGCRPAPAPAAASRRFHHEHIARTQLGAVPDPAAAPCRRPARHSAAHGAGLAARQAERRVQAVVRQDRGRHVLQEAHAAHAAVAARIATAAPEP